MMFIVSVTVPNEHCQSSGSYMGVMLKNADGTADAWPDNDYIAMLIPPMKCNISKFITGSLFCVSLSTLTCFMYNYVYINLIS